MHMVWKMLRNREFPVPSLVGMIYGQNQMLTSLSNSLLRKHLNLKKFIQTWIPKCLSC